MKKILLVIAVVISATVANAQIKKVWSGPIVMFGSEVQVADFHQSLIGNYFMTSRGAGDTYGDTYYYDIIDASSLSIVKTFTFIVGSQESWFGIKDGEEGPYYMSKGIFSADGKWACFVYLGEGISQIRNEDGTVLETFEDHPCNINVTKTGDSYKLLVPADGYNVYDIYSLPGNDMTQNLVATPLPKNMTARKIVQNGQVLVETEKNTYNLQGQEIR